MVGETLIHSQANITGKVDATSFHPDGRVVVRIDDHWLFRDECEEA